jgi:hypothetical protein
MSEMLASHFRAYSMNYYKARQYFKCRIKPLPPEEEIRMLEYDSKVFSRSLMLLCVRHNFYRCECRVLMVCTHSRVNLW